MIKEAKLPLRQIRRIKREIILVYTKLKKDMIENIESSAENLAFFKVLNENLDKIKNKEKLFALFKVTKKYEFDIKLREINKEARNTYDKILKLSNFSFEDFLDYNKSIKEFNYLIEVKEKEAKIRKNTNLMFWSIFFLLIPNIILSTVIESTNSIFIKIICTLMSLVLIIASLIKYIILKTKIAQIDKRNIYDKLSSFPLFFSGIIINILFLLVAWNVNIPDTYLIIIMLLFNMLYLITAFGSIIIDSKLLANKYEVLAVSLLMATALIIIQNFYDEKNSGYFLILYNGTLIALSVIWTISVLYTAFFNTDFKKKTYKYFYIFILCVIFTITLWVFSIYELFYNPEDNFLFTNIITLFSAICGGVLTLGGVAWTLKNENQKTRNEKYSNILLNLDCEIKYGTDKSLVNNS